jgi:hypothetical protein
VKENNNIEIMKEKRKDENYYETVAKEQEEEDIERGKQENYDKNWEYE